MTNPDNRRLELRLLKIASWLVAGGTALTGFFFGMRQAASFACGGVLAGISVFSLRALMSSMVLQDRKASKRRALAGFVLRLLLIPLGLYAMIRFLFLSPIAIIAGFSLFYLAVPVEGLLEAIGSKPE